MRPTTIPLALAMFQVLVIAQPISTFPYSEDFDAFATCGTSATSSCVLSAGWANLGGDNGDWLVDTGGTGSSATGPQGDAPAHGPGNYLYFETSSPAAAGWEIHLQSPDFDTSLAPGVGFTFWYHMYGAEIGELRAEIFDPVAGTYSTVFSVTGQQQTSEADPWLQTPPLPLTSPTGITHIRIVGTKGGASFHGDMAIDLFEAIDFSAPSMSLDSLDTPVGGCGLGAAEVISVTWSNFSSVPFMNVPIQYTITGPVSVGPVVEMIPMAAAFSSGSFAFAATADFATAGLYQVDVTVMLPMDIDPADDTVAVGIGSGGGLSIPICEDWEGGPNGWTAMGTTTFALGQPAGTLISNPPPSGGVNSWVTNLTGPYDPDEDGWVESPELVFCDMLMPEVQVDLWVEAETSWDGAVMQSTIDDGLTWQNVGAFLDGGNWYNDNSINSMPGGQQEGWSGSPGTFGWVVATNTAPALAGQIGRLRIAFSSDAINENDGFAFDNLIIREQGLNTDFDTGASTPAQPVPSTEGSTDVVALQFLLRANGGTDALRGVDLIASGSGDDLVDVQNVSIWVEDPMTTNGMIDPGTDTVLFSGVFPADDGTLTAAFAPYIMEAGVDQNFLVAYDFSAVVPSGMFTVTLANPRVCGTLNPPMAAPVGTIDLSGCSTTLCGDCNLDGLTTITDALAAAQNAAGIITLPPMTPQFSNCNVQGSIEPDPGAIVDVIDALAIAQFAAGLPVVMTCC